MLFERGISYTHTILMSWWTMIWWKMGPSSCKQIQLNIERQEMPLEFIKNK